jgi:DNA-binding MarR family transcriptional regulator
MAGERSLSALLSQALVAFTIEFDNEAGTRIPHVTTVARQAGESSRGAWLVSLPMWANFMRFVDEPGTPLRELTEQAALTNLKGLLRWGYITIAPDPDDRRAQPPRGDWLVRPTRFGRVAEEVWRPLDAAIEARWAERFGVGALAELRGALGVVAAGVELELPHYLPVAGVHRQDPERWRPRAPAPVEDGLELSALLARVLLAFSVDYERQSRLSLALSANVLRVLDQDGLRVRDLPLAVGVSKEAISVSLGFLARAACAVIEPDPAAARTKRARLTARGLQAQAKYRRLLAATEAVWRARHGAPALDALAGSLRALIDARDERGPLLALGLVPPPGSWRARKPYLAQTEAMLADPGGALPHHPMVSHRGGYPDGN